MPSGPEQHQRRPSLFEEIEREHNEAQAGAEQLRAQAASLAAQVRRGIYGPSSAKGSADSRNEPQKVERANRKPFPSTNSIYGKIRLMAVEDGATHQTPAPGEASPHEKFDTHASQSPVQKNTVVESAGESSRQGSDADTSNSIPANAGRGIEQVAREQRHKNVSSKPSHASRALRPNPLKRKIAELKLRRLSAGEICATLDRLLERGSGDYKPLDSWQEKTKGSKRSWLDLFGDKQTHNAVRTFINKIHPSRY
jgi:hypothetical protein